MQKSILLMVFACLFLIISVNFVSMVESSLVRDEIKIQHPFFKFYEEHLSNDILEKSKYSDELQFIFNLIFLLILFMFYLPISTIASIIYSKMFNSIFEGLSWGFFKLWFSLTFALLILPFYPHRLLNSLTVGFCRIVQQKLNNAYKPCLYPGNIG